MEIAPNVHWLEGGGNFYLCVEADGLTVIDTGMPKNEHRLWSLLSQLACKPTDITRILLTHADIDHVGSLAAIQQASKAAVYASADTAEMIRTGTMPQHLPPLLNAIANRFMHYDPISADVIHVVKEGDVLPILGGLEVLASPGHTLDHHAFFAAASGLLFAGDALQTRGNRIGTLPKMITADAELAIRSIIKLLQLSPAIIACGHGKPKGDHSSDELMTLFNKMRRQLIKQGG